MKTLGPIASTLLSRLGEQGKDIFTLRDIQGILHTSENNVRKLAHDLVKRNWLKRLATGKYLLVPLAVPNQKEYTVNELLIAAQLVSPYYLSWWTAMHHYGYTEQVTRKVYIGTVSQKKPLVIDGVTYQFVRLNKGKFFGFIDVWIQDKKVKIASREKMVIDCLDRPDLCGGLVEAVKGLWNAREEINFTVLVRMTHKNANGTVNKRLGYLMDFLKLGSKSDLTKLKKEVSAGYSLLDPTLPKTGTYNSKWNILENVRREDLLSWKEH